jgi:hypothetical protein
LGSAIVTNATNPCSSKLFENRVAIVPEPKVFENVLLKRLKVFERVELVFYEFHTLEMAEVIKCENASASTEWTVDWAFRPFTGPDVVQARDACTEMWLPVDHHDHLAWVFVQRLIHQAMQLTKEMKRRNGNFVRVHSASERLRYDLWLVSPCVDCSICSVEATKFCVNDAKFCVREWLSMASHGIARLVDLFSGQILFVRVVIVSSDHVVVHQIKKQTRWLKISD